MIKPWRPLVAVALNLTVGAGLATAQTVMVKQAPPGETIEVVLNATKVASGTTEPTGDATLPLDLSSIGKTDVDANVFVDACDALHRIVVVERTKLPDPQQPGCVRRDIPGLYWVRRINTVVVNLGGPTPTLLLIKGAYHEDRPHTWTQAPMGLVVSGGGVYGNMRDTAAIFCGTVTQCSGKNAGFGFNGGVTFWLMPFLGVEATYLRPRKITAQGSDTTFTFNSSQDPQIGTISAKIGVPVGPARIYGTAGMNYHKATFTTTETIAAVSQTQTFKTKGWGWAFGGGMELWIARSVALYGDLNFLAIKGKDEAGGEGRIDDRLRFVSFGARVHIGK
jgi:opacity protein-like surface antigen